MAGILHRLPQSSRKLLLFGQALTLGGILLFSGFTIYSVFAPNVLINAEFRDAFQIPEDFTGEITSSMRLLGLFLITMSSITGIAGLFVTFQLLGAFRRGEVFTLVSARRLRLIGWLVFLLAPLDILLRCAGIAIFNFWLLDGAVEISLSLEDGHVFAASFGLLLVVVAHVMMQAIAISEDNQSIV